MARKRTGEGITLQSVTKAIDVLTLLAESPAPLKATEISKATGIHPTTIYGILNTLEQRDIIEKNHTANNYSLGPELLRFGLAYERNSPIVRSASRIANQFSGKWEADVRLALLNGACEIINLRLISHRGLQNISSLLYSGQIPLPVLASSSGKVLLAFIQGERKEIFLARNGLNITPEIESMLNEILTLGYATDFDETFPGYSCVAAPIFGRNGLVAAAISYSGETAYIKEHKDELAAHIKSLGNFISIELGYTN